MTTSESSPTLEWDPWASVEPGGWQDVGTFSLEPEWYQTTLDALELPAAVLEQLGEHMHPGVLAMDLLSRLSRHFRTNEAPPRPDSPKMISLQLRQRCRMEGPIRRGEQMRLIGRIVSKQMEPRPTLVRQAWVMGEDGTPRFFYQQTSRLVQVGGRTQS